MSYIFPTFWLIILDIYVSNYCSKILCFALGVSVCDSYYSTFFGWWSVWELSHGAAGRLGLLSNSARDLRPRATRSPCVLVPRQVADSSPPSWLLPLPWPCPLGAVWHLWLYPSTSRTQGGLLSHSWCSKEPTGNIAQLQKWPQVERVNTRIPSHPRDQGTSFRNPHSRSWQL